MKFSEFVVRAWKEKPSLSIFYALYDPDADTSFLVQGTWPSFQRPDIDPRFPCWRVTSKPDLVFAGDLFSVPSFEGKLSFSGVSAVLDNVKQVCPLLVFYTHVLCKDTLLGIVARKRLPPPSKEQVEAVCAQQGFAVKQLGAEGNRMLWLARVPPA